MSEQGGRLKGVDRVFGPVVWFAAGALVVMLFVGPILIAEDEPQQAAAEQRETGRYGGEAAAEGEGGAAAAAGDGEAAAEADGEALFAENCGSCHTLSAAGTSGAVGPNLDDAGLDAATIAGIVSDGQGGMPSFEGELDEDEIDAIASFVAGSGG